MTVIRNTLTHIHTRTSGVHTAANRARAQTTKQRGGNHRDFSSSISGKDAELSITAHTSSRSACKLMGKRYNEALKMSFLPLI